MQNTVSVSEVKPYSWLAKLKAKLERLGGTRGFGGGRRYGRFDREAIEALKLALVPHLLTIARRLFPYGMLSRTGGYWVIPALGIQVNLATGDFFPWPSEPGRRTGDFLTLYMAYSELPFRQAVASLNRIASDIANAPLPPLLVRSKENGRAKRHIVGLALCGTNGGLSALAVRRRVLAYLALHPDRYPKAKEEHPEFFSSAPFARLLSAWSILPEARQEFLRVRQGTEGKNILFFFLNLNPNPNENEQ